MHFCEQPPNATLQGALRDRAAQRRSPPFVKPQRTAQLAPPP